MRSRTALRSFVVALSCVLATGMAGCGGKGGEVPELSGNEPLSHAIMEVSDSGEAVRVDSLTDFEWDEVALFTEGTLRSDIEAVVGETGFRRDRFTNSTNLFVFLDDGKIVAQLMTYPDALRGEYRTRLGPDAQLVPDSEWEGFVRLTE